MESLAMESASPVFRLGRFRFEVGRQLTCDGTPTVLGARGLALLRELVLAGGDVVTKDELLSSIWSNGAVVVENALQQHASSLRRALGPDGHWIAAISGVGYRFAGPIEAEGQASGAQPPSLPAALSDLIGRESDLVRVQDLLDRNRLLTLVGPGGIGKTRLALEAGRERATRHPDGTFFVELASVGAGRLVPAAVVAATGAVGRPDEVPERRIGRALRRSLLILDNCEHVVDSVAELAQSLLRSCPCLTILATSQEPIGIEGEQLWRVPELGMPATSETSAASIMAASAVRLLLARIHAQDPDFQIGPSSAPTAAALCRGLDGNPLAIELAAARVPTLGLDAVGRQLSSRFRLLTSGRRAAPAKHRTLQSLMDWSYELCREEEQRGLRALATFEGGFQPDDGVALITDSSSGRIDGDGCLRGLVTRSLVATSGTCERPRLKLLETQRSYAMALLRAAPTEHAAARRAHARRYAVVFDAAYDDWNSTTDAEWLARYGPEVDNLRAAINTCQEIGEHDEAARLLGASTWLWRPIGAVPELRRHLARVLTQAPAAASCLTRARLHLCEAWSLQIGSSDSMSLLNAGRRAVEDFANLNESFGRACALLCVASAYIQLGRPEAQLAILRDVEPLIGSRGKTRGWFCDSMAWACHLSDDLDAALCWVRRSIEVHGLAGSVHGELRALAHAVDLLLSMEQLDAAREEGQALVDRLRATVHDDYLGRALANLGAAHLAARDVDQAKSCLVESLGLLRSHDFSFWVYDHLAELAVHEGRFQDAAVALGFANAGYTRLCKGRRMHNEQRARDRALQAIHRNLPQAVVEALVAQGDAAREEDAEQIAMGAAAYLSAGSISCQPIDVSTGLSCAAGQDQAIRASHSAAFALTSDGQSTSRHSG
jgi:predicted ATPase/DNA-binding winged helix-turn-helix (wHTH) protein